MDNFNVARFGAGVGVVAFAAVATVAYVTLPQVPSVLGAWTGVARIVASLLAGVVGFTIVWMVTVLSIVTRGF